jgi:hypothetical protein
MVERFNRTLQQMLSMFVDEHQRDWDDHLPYVMMAYRTSVHESSGCTPNLLMFGREISLPIDIMVGLPPQEDKMCAVEYVQWVQNTLRHAYEFAKI